MAMCCFLQYVAVAYTTLSNEALKRIAKQTDTNTTALLAPLLVKRVPGTPEHAQVQTFIVNHFESLGWRVEEDAFEAPTPLGTVAMKNIIVTSGDAGAPGLVLAAHYDSKLFEEFDFVGATDSAAPCAMLLQLATQLPAGANVRFIFFDGEEAFVSWTATDSIYGARHLAERWENEKALSSIEVLVLLDLLGAANPIIPNFYPDTHDLFMHLSSLETRLRNLGLIAQSSPFFEPNTPLTYRGHLMQDDHVPFLHRGVKILHVIPYPFPDGWHNAGDNAEALDMPTIEAWTLIWRCFVSEYLNMDTILHSEL
ncbi:hypothetical protein BCR43DRAFT_513538 [Syncephalastrum racemosum]|uniref:Peptide hydrolase n=1 Tax=Syncephalastrum racemosum TaxID=13706 RepID=A0A1X2HJZ7_SYNRA|nr:hypothetical protein BCR43DRAFT_513538 [Syncephalastrum racemosum]